MTKEAPHESLDRVKKILAEMAARQPYHDEAFERFNADMELMKEAQAVDTKRIRELVRVAELHHQSREDGPAA